MNKTRYINEVEIRYDDGVRCETFRMNRLDFGAFLAPLDEKLGLVLRDKKNFKNGAIILPDQKAYNAFTEELTYQGAEVSKRYSNGVTQLSFHEIEEEKSIEDFLTSRANEMREAEFDDPSIEAVLEEEPSADVRDVKDGIFLMSMHKKEYLRNFYD